MAELLVRVQQRADYDPIKNKLTSQVGDVIDVCEDGHPWSKRELENPDWRIVSMPGEAADYDYLIKSAFDSRKEVVALRAQNFDAMTTTKIAALPVDQVAALSPLDEAAVTIAVKDVTPIEIG